MENKFNNKCKMYEDQMSLYIDGELSENEKIKFEKHISSCENCKMEFNNIKQIMNDLKSLETIELPIGFHEEFMKKIKEEKIMKVVNKKNKLINLNFKRYTSIAAGFLFICFILTAGLRMIVTTDSIDQTRLFETDDVASYSLGNSDLFEVGQSEGEIESYSLKSLPPETASTEIEDNDGLLTASRAERSLVSDVVNASEEINIKSYNLTLESEKFDETVAVINTFDSYIINNSTYISDDEYGEQAYTTITLNVPDVEYYDIINQFKTLGKVKDEYEEEHIIAFELRDANMSIKTKEQEIENLFSLMQKTETVKDMMTVENRITTVISDIEYLKSNIKNWTNEKENPTIYVSVIENSEDTLYKEENKPLAERVEFSFIESINTTTRLFEDVTLWISYRFVPIVLICVIAYIIYRISRRR